ncbi:WD40-repeat-containing domain protein [Sphaerosporella brunnea]|uniref:WD40-repeat-containing domain protein n=1 Tax=Sphaerosporella brunnea TaxID=1250544 RepID=A0A5J5F291_9PEZI|nr:WD40-repeat-containing domain protein [Sphaerosporella brunnea]
MFVLPPPPIRYPPANPYGTGIGAPVPILETSNTIKNPTGPEWQFSVGEGTYTLKEDIFLATPPPHPSEPPITNPNPLSTAPQAFVGGTKISLLQIKGGEIQNHHHQIYRNPTVATSRDTQDGASRISGDTDEDSSIGLGGSGSLGSKSGEMAHVPEKFGNGNASLSVATGKNVKKKPKSNIAKSNSSFVSRIIQHENLTKRLQERSSEDLMLFANINRAFNWLDMDSAIKQEPLSKILFTKAHPICHDVNMVTRSTHQIDVIIGFSTGDIIWFDPISNKYARINKNGTINSHAVTEIKWLPGSERLFLAAHNDGSLVVYDRDKEDAPFVPEDAPTHRNANSNGASPASMMGSLGIRKSVTSTNQKSNPVSYWSVAKGPITAFAISSDCEHLAVVSEDECLRVFNYVKEKLLDVHCSYYGGLLCVCWSPDGRYILTGGQDDLVSIWSVVERRIVARCEGHHSWVSSVSFDPWRCDDRTYRFGSVGHDCRLLLWDFSVGMLHKPKAAANHRRGSMSSASPSHHQPVRARGDSLSQRLRSSSSVAVTANSMDDGHETLVHPVDARAQTAVLPPVMSKVIDPCPLSQLVFREDAIITTCMDGHVKTWNRPQLRTGSEVTLSASAAGS